MPIFLNVNKPDKYNRENNFFSLTSTRKFFLYLSENFLTQYLVRMKMKLKTILEIYYN